MIYFIADKGDNYVHNWYIHNDDFCTGKQFFCIMTPSSPLCSHKQASNKIGHRNVVTDEYGIWFLPLSAQVCNNTNMNIYCSGLGAAGRT